MDLWISSGAAHARRWVSPCSREGVSGARPIAEASAPSLRSAFKQGLERWTRDNRVSNRIEADTLPGMAAAERLVQRPSHV